jgi:mitogen-activated protein kinase kinase
MIKKPERITNVGKITIQADIWSFGLTLIEIATGRFPYAMSPASSTLGIMDLYEMIVEEPAPTLPSRFSHAFCDVVQHMYRFINII